MRCLFAAVLKKESMSELSDIKCIASGNAQLAKDPSRKWISQKCIACNYLQYMAGANKMVGV